jgi:hypothetical protein
VKRRAFIKPDWWCSGVMKPLRFALVLLPALLAWACAQTNGLAAWEIYDGCKIQVTSFTGMVGCGEERLKAYCGSSRSEPACGTLGNAVAAYADSLMKLVEAKQITDQLAQRKWAEFELLSPAEQIRASQAATAAAAAR